MAAPKCESCSKGPADGVTLHRTGRKGRGENPHWRCWQCLSLVQAANVDPVVLEITNIINPTPPN